MTLVCSVRRVGGVHVVTMPETKVTFRYRDNCYQPSVIVKKPVLMYPGSSSGDRVYREFAKQRKKEIKQTVPAIKPLANFDKGEKSLMDCVFAMRENARKIHNHKIVYR